LEHNWDRETFLNQTCRKAGLPMDAWRNGATVEAFTAEIFGEKH
jgi:AMMECR1 domain-containing protein